MGYSLIRSMCLHVGDAYSYTSFFNWLKADFKHKHWGVL